LIMKRIYVLDILCVILLAVFSTGCKKNSDSGSSIQPIVVTNPSMSIGSTSAVSGGKLTNATAVTDKGVIWGTDSSALSVSASNKISNGTGPSGFTDTIINLLPHTKYYVKAYAVTGSLVTYGVAMSFTTSRAVYLAGYNGSSAAYWKDGKLFSLQGGDYARSIFVVGNDVYVAGQNTTNLGLQAVYWKNGVPVYLNTGNTSAVANSIFVDGSDIYVAGYELFNNMTGFPVAKYWKNGLSVPLVDGTYHTGVANSLIVNAGDIYVGGYVSRGPGSSVNYAAYWKNGRLVPLSDSTKTIATVQSIFVKGTDVYAVGYEKGSTLVGGISLAKYWKNGLPVTLTDGTRDAVGWWIYVNGSDVYVAGSEYSTETLYSIAKYWKNGIAFSLTDGNEYGSAYGIFALDGDVYVTGGEDDYFDAKYWKNGIVQPLQLTGKYTRTLAMFVQ